MKLSIDTCTRLLNDAALNRKSAFQIELAVGLAIFIISGDTEKAAKSVLTSTYSSAGYECLTTSEIDYKTINRRVNATAQLCEKFTLKKVRKWAGELEETAAIDAIVSALQPHELFNIRDVQRFCDPNKPPPRRKTFNAPAAQHARRATDKNAEHIKTAHLDLAIPQDVAREELIELAMTLLKLAEAKK